MGEPAAETVNNPRARSRRGAGLLALVLLLAGCASGTGGRQSGTTPSPDPAPSPSIGTSPSGTSSSGTSSSGPTSPTAPPCPPVGTTRLPDGTWAGPLSVKVRATAPETRARGTGTGQLQVSVEQGRVTGGTWALTWSAAGPSTAHESQATVRVHGEAFGTVAGTAQTPVLRGAWTIVGRAAVTSPVTATAAIDASGKAQSGLAVRTRSCDAVAGTLALRFPSTDGFAASAGKARWTARRTG
jgi:hypothetical protein